MKRLLIPIALLAALPQAALAQEYLPPAELVARALSQHPDVLAADARIAAAEAAARGADAGPYEFEITGGHARRQVRGDRTYSDFDASLTRGVRLPGKRAMDRRAGVLGVEVAAKQRAETWHQTALVLLDHWYDWLGAAAEVKVQATTVAGHEHEVAGLRRRLELKDASALEVDQGVLALEGARAALASAQSRADSAKARLDMLFPDMPFPAVAPDVPEPALSADQAAGWRDLIVAHDHGVEAAAAEVDRVKALADRARKDRMPDPNLGVRLFSERGGAEWGGGVTASIPIGGGRRAAAADEQTALSRAAVAALASANATNRADAEASRITALNAIRVLQAQRAALDSAREAARRLRVGYENGASDLSELLYAERQASEAARAEILQRTEASRAVTRMRVDAHLLWAEDGG